MVYLFSTDTNALTEAHHREIQRRSDASVEHASVLPPDVVSVLTQCDQVEQAREELHQQSHGKLMITIEKFFTKLEAEEKKYRARMEELEVPIFFDSILFSRIIHLIMNTFTQVLID